MTLVRQLLLAAALATALAAAPGCLATWSAHDQLVSHGNEPRSTTGTAVFIVALPVLLAVDIITSPFQWAYVVTHAR